MIGILVISRCAAPPYPAAPDFPPSGGQNKSLYAFLQRHGSIAKPPKGECISLARRAVVKVLSKLAPSINLEAPSTTLSGIAAVKLKNPRGHSPVKL